MVHHPSSTKICQEKCQLRHFWTCVHCLWLFLFVHDHQNQSLHWPGKRKHGSLSLQSQTAASMMKSTQWTWSPTHWQSPPGTQVLKFSSDKLYVCSGRFGVSDYPFMRAMINQAIKLCNETLWRWFFTNIFIANNTIDCNVTGKSWESHLWRSWQWAASSCWPRPSRSWCCRQVDSVTWMWHGLL